MAPFVLKFKGNKSFSPLGQISDAETLTRTWKVCTKVASHLEQGQRLENLSWRLWFLQIALVQADNAKQKREFKKFSKGMSDKLDKDKGRAITELQAPNFKRTDSTDKVRLRVEEMAHQRDAGPGGSGNPYGGGAAGRFANDPDAAAAHYMKGMQYTFAVDPRVKPLATTAMPTTDEQGGGGGGGMNSKGRAGGGMMGKMRVRPMHPPPVPQRVLANANNNAQAAQTQAQTQAQATGAKDASGDTTMHVSATSSKHNEHAMDVSEDHAQQNHAMDEDHREHASIESDQHQSIQPYQPDEDFQFEAEAHGGEGAKHGDHDIEADNEGHHTPTPQHLLLPSHHPSALPYPPPPPTLANAHALSNALTGASGLFIPGSSNSSSSNSTTPRGASYGSSSGMNMHQGQGQQTQPNIIRFPTIFSSDFGPTSLLCALPSNSNPASFSFESSPSPGPTSAAGYQSFSALGAGANSGVTGHTTTSSSITTQGIYGPHSNMGVGMRGGGGGSSGLTGIGVGMQNAETSFDFGVPRPTFEFPIEEILKGDGMDGTGANGAPGSGITPWDANNLNASLSLLGESIFGMGAGSMNGQWSVQPQEIHSPTTESTTSKFPTTSSASSRQNSMNSAAYGVNNAGGASQNQQQAGAAARNSLSPVSVHSNTSNPHATHASSSGANTIIKSEALYDTIAVTPASATASSSSASASVSQQISGGATASGQVLGGSGGVGSVVPGNVGNTAPGGVKSECANCGATHTPLWRRGLNDELNCNACGLYCKLHKRARPKNLRTSHGDRAGSAWGAKAGDAELAGEPVQCHNCATMATPLWRKDDEGNTLCNACGLYLKLHGNRRPLSMKSDVIRKRSRHETEKRTSVSSIITVMTPTNNIQNSRRNSPTPPPSAGSNSSGPEPFVEPATGTNSIDPMAFPFGQEFAFGETDYMSGLGMGMGSDMTNYSSFGSYGFSDAHSSAASSMGNGNGLASPTSPTEIQHIVETTVMAGIENGGGHTAPNAKRRRMTLESTFSGSSLAHTSGGANSAHSSPSGLGQKAHGNSPPYFSLDATLNNANSNSNSGNSSGHGDQSGHMSPTRSTFGSNSPPQPTPSISGVTYDYYGYPIHPPMVPLHPPSLIHPHSLMWGESQNQHTPTQQSSMNHARSHSQSMSRSPSHSRRHSHSHSRSNSHNITMPLYLYDGGASSRAYEGANASTPTANGYSSSNPTDEELVNSGFDMFTDHSGTMEENRVHYGPTSGI